MKTNSFNVCGVQHAKFDYQFSTFNIQLAKFDFRYSTFKIRRSTCQVL